MKPSTSPPAAALEMPGPTWYRWIFGGAFVAVVVLVLLIPFNPTIGGCSMFLLPVLGAFFARPKWGLLGGTVGGFLGGALIGLTTCWANEDFARIWSFIFITGLSGIPGGLMVGAIVQYFPDKFLAIHRKPIRRSP